jgi:hypothetical protein
MTEIDEAIARVEAKFPNAFWLIGKGRTKPEEPLFAVRVCHPDDIDVILAEGEGDTLAGAVERTLADDAGPRAAENIHQ